MSMYLSKILLIDTFTNRFLTFNDMTIKTTNKNFSITINQLWSISLPLMMSSLSSMVMMFVDRLILAHYSLDAHNVAAEATNIGWSFLAGWIALCSVTQIFVAQNYGAGKHHQLGQPVWQIIWLALGSVIIFSAMTLSCPNVLFGNEASCETQRMYLRCMLVFGPLHGLFGALNGFFIGQGKTFLPTIVILIGNIINGFCCYLLVFGYGHFIPPMGAIGAAISMNVAVVGQVAILFLSFLSRENRATYGTGEYRCEPQLMKKCIIVGLPQAVFYFLEVAGWGVFYKMMSSLSEKHLTVASIVQNLLILFMFFGDGLSRGVAALAGNAIGAGQFKVVFKIVKTGFVAMTFFAILFAAFLWFAHQLIIDQFLSSVHPETRKILYPSLVFGFANAVVYKYLEGVRMVITGALTAAADTLFLLVAGTCSIWLFMVTPIYFFVVIPKASIETALILCSLYTLFSAVIYLIRFYTGSWQQHSTLVTR
jgi:MATE family multidrug resistance protein